MSDAKLTQWANATGSLFSSGDVSCAAERCALKTAPYAVGTADGAALPLCAGEVFRGQPRAGYCSAFLVGPDLVATAGHCMLNQGECDAARLVFGYTADANGQNAKTTVPAGDVYSCVELVDQTFEGASALDDDWALFRLDRPVAGRTPLSVRQTGAVEQDAELVMAGHPLGLPLKVTTHGEVRENVAERPKFSTSLDGSPGNSGSPVIDRRTGLVEGVLTAGPSTEWVRASAPDGTACAAARVCDANGGCEGSAFPEWADATRVSGIAAALGEASQPAEGSEGAATGWSAAAPASVSSSQRLRTLSRLSHVGRRGSSALERLRLTASAPESPDEDD